VDIIVRKNSLLRCAGSHENQTLLLLPGFADNGTMFMGLFDTPLADRFRLIAVDLPGFESSPRDADIGTLHDYGAYVADLATDVAPNRPVGIAGHSVASIIAVLACERLQRRAAGLFSIEGILTSSDAYFSGNAAEHADPSTFKTAFLEDVWARVHAQPILRRYHSSVMMADSVSMWQLGNNAKRMSAVDQPGQQLLALKSRKLYYWSPVNTPDTTRQWIEAHPQLPSRQFHNASHWPTVDQPIETARAMFDFFEQAQKSLLGLFDLFPDALSWKGSIGKRPLWVKMRVMVTATPRPLFIRLPTIHNISSKYSMSRVQARLQATVVKNRNSHRNHYTPVEDGKG